MHIVFINYSPELNGCSHSLVSNDSRHGYADKLTEVVDRAHHRQLPFFFLAHKSKLYNISRKYNTNIIHTKILCKDTVRLRRIL